MASAREAIEAAKDRLRTARFGLADMRGHPKRHDAGLMNAIVFGRMVTQALQNMRGHVEGFDEWYGPVQAQLREDPLMRAFWELRNTVEKRADRIVSAEMTFSHFNTNMIPDKPPPFAEAFVIGAVKYGNASGWLLKFPSGEEDFYPVELPPNSVKSSLTFANFPEPLRHRQAIHLVEEYLDSLAEVVADAERKFIRQV